jgi:hypothetical protein
MSRVNRGGPSLGGGLDGALVAVLLTAAVGTAAVGVAGCARPSPAPAAAPQPVAAAPPVDDEKVAPAIGEHAAALEQLKQAPFGAPREDAQNSLTLGLPDGEHWTRVHFWGVPTLVGFRYGKEHHAVIGAWVVHVADNKVQGACGKAFEEFAKPFVATFELEVTHEEPTAFIWQKEIVEVDVFRAKTATLLSHEEYAAAVAAYPVWKNGCLVIGFAAPFRGDEARAIAARARFVKEAFPTLKITAAEEPKERY